MPYKYTEPPNESQLVYRLIKIYLLIKMLYFPFLGIIYLYIVALVKTMHNVIHNLWITYSTFVFYP